MVKKKLVEFGGTPSPIRHPNLARVRLFLDIFVMALVLLGFLFFVFTLISSKIFLPILVFGALYVYVARKFI